MGKNNNNLISISDDMDSCWKKLAKVQTDPARVTLKDPGNPDICIIFSYHKLFTDDIEQEEIFIKCVTADIGCVKCKQILIHNLK